MAKNELVALALVYYEPMHTYAITSVIKAMELDIWAKISPASIYNTLARLEKRESVSVSIEKFGNMPDRKVYTLTDKGEKHLRDEMREAITTTNIHNNYFHLAVAFGFGLSASEGIEVATERIENFKKLKEVTQKKYNTMEENKILTGMIGMRSLQRWIDIEVEATEEFIDLLKHNYDFYETKMKELFTLMKKSLEGDTMNNAKKGDVYEDE